MPSLRAVLFFTVAVLGFQLASAAEFQFGSLRLSFPEGYAPTKTTPPFELSGPNGEKILISVMRAKADVDGQKNEEEQGKMAQVGVGFLHKQAKAAGAVVVPLEEQALPDGSLFKYIGSETSSLFSSGYFFQYLLVSPSGRLAFVTAEGKGEGSGPHQRLLPIVQSATWAP